MSEIDLEGAFARIPMLQAFKADDFRITELSGYTNRNYRLQRPGQDWVLRLPKAATDVFIERETEAHNQSLAHQLGIAPMPVWRDDAGISLTRTLATARPLHARDFDDRLASIVDPVRRLHQSGFEFRGYDSLQSLLWKHYEQLSDDQRASLSQRMQQAERVLSLLEDDDQALVPSHRDLVMENLLLDDEQLWLIDWEYSAMASPYWDLATLCNEADLNLEQSRQLLQVYCAGDAAMQESRLFDYRGLLKLLTDCWMLLLVD